MIQELISSVIQVILASIIPLAWWFVTARKKENFFKWIGLKKIENIKVVFLPTVSTIIGLTGLGYLTLVMLQGAEKATNDYAGLGIAGLPVVIIYALIHTALSEELFFRGFLLKRLSHQFGFVIGNSIQAFVFAAIHGILFFGAVGLDKALIIMLFTGALVYVMGYINEKLAQGSILTSWFIHFVGNLFAGILSVFSIL